MPSPRRRPGDERPVILTADEVRAALTADRGTLARPFAQTPWPGDEPDYWLIGTRRRRGFDTNKRVEEVRNRRNGKLISSREFLVPFDEWLAEVCPHAAVGDLLWGQETWCPAGSSGGVWYKAGVPVYEAGFRTGAWDTHDRTMGVPPPPRPRWRSPLHMPRWVARTLVRVTAVRYRRPDPAADPADHDAARWWWLVDWEWAGHDRKITPTPSERP